MKKKIKLRLNKKTISNLEHIFGGTGDTIIQGDLESVYIGPCPDPYYTITCQGSCRRSCGTVSCLYCPDPSIDC